MPLQAFSRKPRSASDRAQRSGSPITIVQSGMTGWQAFTKTVVRGRMKRHSAPSRDVATPPPTEPSSPWSALVESGSYPWHGRLRRSVCYSPFSPVAVRSTCGGSPIRRRSFLSLPSEQDRRTPIWSRSRLAIEPDRSNRIWAFGDGAATRRSSCSPSVDGTFGLSTA